MSMFLPEGAATQPVDGVSSITPSNPETTTEDIALMQRVLSAASRNPNLIPADFMSYVLDYIQVSRLQIPIGQVFGFTQFSAQASPFVGGASARSSSVFGNLPDGLGPGISGLPAGQYIFFWGCLGAGNPGVAEAEMRLLANSSTPSSNSCATSVASSASIMCADVFDLSNEANDVLAQYASSDNTFLSTFSQRWIIGLKFANL